jgi:luciferase family oxidoreductase group 1
MTKFSILDLVSVNEGASDRDALLAAGRLAGYVERLGFERYWVAEHHGMAGIASAATAVVLAHIGYQTSRIRIGAGGIMLPNHSPMQVAEQFGTLEALFPGRIDLGLGRAPGSDGRVAQALRRNLHSDVNQFPRDVMELRALLAGDPEVGIIATPGAGSNVPLWILGSSLFGAQLAALLGLPFAFASHFAPQDLIEALMVYRQQFRPSEMLDKPYAMAGFNVFAADSVDEAQYLASSMQQSFVALRFGTPGRLQPPVHDYATSLDVMGQKLLRSVLKYASIGTEADVARDLQAFIDLTGVDEVIISSSIFDEAARHRSFEIVAGAIARMNAEVVPA